MEQLEPLCNADRNVHWYNFGKHLETSIQIKSTHSLWVSVSNSMYELNRNIWTLYQKAHKRICKESLFIMAQN